MIRYTLILMMFMCLTLISSNPTGIIVINNAGVSTFDTYSTEPLNSFFGDDKLTYYGYQEQIDFGLKIRKEYGNLLDIDDIVKENITVPTQSSIFSALAFLGAIYPKHYPHLKYSDDFIGGALEDDYAAIAPKPDKVTLQVKQIPSENKLDPENDKCFQLTEEEYSKITCSLVENNYPPLQGFTTKGDFDDICKIIDHLLLESEHNIKSKEDVYKVFGGEDTVNKIKINRWYCRRNIQEAEVKSRVSNILEKLKEKSFTVVYADDNLLADILSLLINKDSLKDFKASNPEMKNLSEFVPTPGSGIVFELHQDKVKFKYYNAGNDVTQTGAQIFKFPNFEIPINNFKEISQAVTTSTNKKKKIKRKFNKNK